MAKRDDPNRVTRQVAAGLLLAVCMAPWGAGMAATHADGSSRHVGVTSSSWRAVISTPGGVGSVGAAVTISSSMWAKSVTYPSPIGKVDVGYIVDAVNIGSESLSAQDYTVTVSQFDVERFVSLWLCHGGTWSGVTCSGSIEQVGTTQDVTANGTYLFHTSSSPNPSHFALGVSSRLSLLLTNDSKGHTVPQNLEALGVRVSRTMSVRAGMSVNT